MLSIYITLQLDKVTLHNIHTTANQMAVVEMAIQ